MIVCNLNLTKDFCYGDCKSCNEAISLKGFKPANKFNCYEIIVQLFLTSEEIETSIITIDRNPDTDKAITDLLTEWKPTDDLRSKSKREEDIFNSLSHIDFSTVIDYTIVSVRYYDSNGLAYCRS